MKMDVAKLYKYLNADLRDAILLSANPMLMAPRYAELPPLALGARRYIAAADGIYIQCRTAVITATLCFVRTPALPYGPVTESLALTYGRIPNTLLDAAKSLAVERCPLEWAGRIEWDAKAEKYALRVTRIVEASTHHIRSEAAGYDDQYSVADIHSHGLLGAFFSPVDDVSDRENAGVYFASVFGSCQTVEAIQVRTRLVIDGHFFPLQRTPWEETHTTRRNCAA